MSMNLPQVPRKNGEYPSAASCALFFETDGFYVNPWQYRPFVRLTGGIHVLPLNGTASAIRSVQALLIAKGWVDYSIEAGATAADALISLAANWDEYLGIVAASLEVAAALNAESNQIISDKEYSRIVEAVYFANIGDIYGRMHNEWGVDPVPDMDYAKCRSEWKEELGHDVLIHPANLQPCRDKDGILIFNSATGSSQHAVLRFQRGSGGDFDTEGFPPIFA